jgi:hypothetical protein
VSIYLILAAALGPGVHSVSNRSDYKKEKNNVSGSRALPVLRADNLTAICEPIARQCWIFDISQPCRPPGPVIGIALLIR